MKKIIFIIAFLIFLFSCGRVTVIDSYRFNADSATVMSKVFESKYSQDKLPKEFQLYEDTLKLDLNFLTFVNIYLKNDNSLLIITFYDSKTQENIKNNYTSLSLRAVVKFNPTTKGLYYYDREDLSSSEKEYYKKYFIEFLNSLNLKYYKDKFD